MKLTKLKSHGLFQILKPTFFSFFLDFHYNALSSRTFKTAFAAEFMHISK